MNALIKLYPVRIILVALIFLTTFIILIMESYDWSEKDKRGEPWFAPFDYQAVSEIELYTRGTRFVVTRDSAGQWVTPNRQNFPIAGEKVNTFLYQMEHLRIAQTLPGFEDSDRAKFLLNDPRDTSFGPGLVATLKLKDNSPDREVICGSYVTKKKQIADQALDAPPLGRYFYSKEAGAGLAVTTFSYFDHGIGYWLTRNIFSIEHVRKVMFHTLPDNQLKWSFSRPSVSRAYTDDRVPGTALDQELLMNFVFPWREPNFYDARKHSANIIATGKTTFITADGLRYEIFSGMSKDASRYDENATAYYWFKVSREPGEITPDCNFDAKGNAIELPRPDSFIIEKLHHEKLFENWIYEIEPLTYQALQSPHSFFIKKTKQK